MARIHIDVSHMAAAPAVPTKYKGAALIAAMKKATARAVDRSANFTTQGKNDSGYSIQYTLASVTGSNPLKCTFKGLVSTLPDDRVVTQSLSGSGAATPPSTVEDVADAVLEDLTKRKVLPTLTAMAEKARK